MRFNRTGEIYYQCQDCGKGWGGKVNDPSIELEVYDHIFNTGHRITYEHNELGELILRGSCFVKPGTVTRDGNTLILYSVIKPENCSVGSDVCFKDLFSDRIFVAKVVSIINSEESSEVDLTIENVRILTDKLSDNV